MVKKFEYPQDGGIERELLEPFLWRETQRPIPLPSGDYKIQDTPKARSAAASHVRAFIWHVWQTYRPEDLIEFLRSLTDDEFASIYSRIVSHSSGERLTQLSDFTLSEYRKWWKKFYEFLKQLSVYPTNIGFLSLFAGIGGIDEALVRNGLHPIAAVDFDYSAIESYRLNFADRFPNADIFHGTVGEALAAHYQGVRLIAGGIPCQDWSSAGSRKMTCAPRTKQSLKEFRDTVELYMPNVWLIENVRGMVEGKALPIFNKEIKEWGENLGYDVHWRKIDGPYVGLAQARPRVVVVAVPAGTEFLWPRYIYGEEPDQIQFQTVQEVLTPSVLQRIHDENEVGHPPLLFEYNNAPVYYQNKKPTVGSTPYKGSNKITSNHHDVMINPNSQVQTILGAKYSAPYRDTKGYAKAYWKDLRYLTDALKQQKENPNIKVYQETKRKGPPSFVVRDQQTGLLKAIDYQEGEIPGAQRITAYEAMLLQGFPEDWQIYAENYSTLWEQIGNACPPAFIEPVVQALLEQEII